jgi:nitronate monooxygenase
MTAASRRLQRLRSGGDITSDNRPPCWRSLQRDFRSYPKAAARRPLLGFRLGQLRTQRQCNKIGLCESISGGRLSQRDFELSGFDGGLRYGSSDQAHIYWFRCRSWACNANDRVLLCASKRRVRVVGRKQATIVRVRLDVSGVGPELTAAVINAGAMAGMPVWPFPTNEAVARVARVRSATGKPFFVNYVLAFEPRSLPAVLEAGAPIVQFSWGMPDRAAIAAVRQAGAKMGIQVTSPASARAALDLGADYLVCQGTEAGGHVQAHSSLLESLPKVLEEAKATPVVASGGIATGADIRKILNAGAAAAMLGTRFVATRESLYHQVYKDALLRANKGDTVLTVCFEGGWPNTPLRVLRNGTFIRWEAAGCPPAGKRPGEGDVLATRPDGSKLLRYSFFSPTVGTTGENLLDLAFSAGEGVGSVRDVPAAGDLVKRLWQETVG